MKSENLNVARAGRVLLLLLSCVWLAACGDRMVRPSASDNGASPTSTDTASEAMSAEDAVKLRALNRWGLLIEKRFEEAYDLLSPGYRQVRPREDYVKIMASRPVQWTKVRFDSAQCEEDVCTVAIEVHIQMNMPVMRVGTVDGLSVITENWVRSGGEWYLVPAADR